MKFTEAKLEEAIIELMEAEGYPHVLGEALGERSSSCVSSAKDGAGAPSLPGVLIKDDLRAFLSKQYAKDGITPGEIESVIQKLDAFSSADLYESNKQIMKMVSDGFLLKREDHTQKDLYVNLIDYRALTAFREPKPDEVPMIVAEEEARYNAAGATFSQNIFKLVNQLEIFGSEKRIPDGILYINGLPLVVFEFKSAIREEATIHDAFIQLTVRYKRDIPELFKYNAFVVISDGVNSKVGSFFAPYEFFYAWRKAERIIHPHPQPLSQGEKGVNYKGGFSYSGLVKRARKLRQTQTPAEEVMWELVRNRQLAGLKFRRQHQIGPYIVDFFCDELKLVFELDGEIHSEEAQAKKDHKRTAYLESLGFTVLRFDNSDFLNDPESALKAIASHKLPSTSGRGGGGEGVSDAQGINSLYTMIGGLFNAETLIDVIRNYIYVPDVSRKEEKILCRYPQYYAATKLYQSILHHMKPQGDGKGGTYFGATGCGKSYTMLFLSRLLMRSVELKSPTIVLITDRTDLDDQLSAQFTNAKGFIGDHTVISVESRSQLRDLLKGRNSGGVFLTTIHKFTEDTELLTERSNVICISDEAHRSQVNLDQKVRVTDEGVTRTFGFAKYLHDSLPNATYVGFTGTPIDATLDVFGPVVDSYTMTESVADEITVRIVYEGRAAKVLLNNTKLEEIERYYAECAEEGASEYAIEESKKAMANMASILGDPQRIEALAADFVEHYEKRVEEGSTVTGKVMFVSSSRPIAYAFYKAVLKYLGERSSRSFFKVAGDGMQQELHPSQIYASSFTKNFGMPEEWHTGILPHRSREGLVQFVTFRLADSLPKDVLEQFDREIHSLDEDQQQTAQTKKIEAYLDGGAGCCALNHPEAAQVVQDALRHHDGERYDLIAWSIMPNHVHVLIRTQEELSKIVQSWKSFTGKWALKNNRKLKLGITTKSFWQSEYWDRFIRNEEHFNQTVAYILANPEKARLPELATAHRFKGCVLNDGMKQELHPSQIKMVMTRGQDDDPVLYDLLGSKKYRKELDRQFKTEKSNFKIAILVDMWLTGFDVPFLDTIYIDKPVQRHNLIQTISRVNRKFEGKNKGLVVDYIGIKKQMNLALAHYSKADQANIEEVQASIVVVKDHLDLLKRFFHSFDASSYFSGSPVAQLQCLNRAAEFVQITEKIERRFMGLVKRLKAAYDICSGSDAFTQDERDRIHFYLAIRSIVAKLAKGDAPDTAQMNAKVREMIAEALQSDGVEEIFKLGEDTATEIDIFEEDYLAKIEKIKLPNTRIKLLQKLLKKAIEEFKKVNKVKGVDFSRQFEALVKKYNERKEDDVLVSNVLEDFSDEIIDLFHALKKEKDSFGELGIDFEEKAFYDILKSLARKYDFTYPEDKLIALSKAVKTVVDDKARYTDWSRRDDIKAELKVDLIILLAEHGYPPVNRDEVYKEIFEQAENFKKYQSARPA